MRIAQKSMIVGLSALAAALGMSATVATAQAPAQPTSGPGSLTGVWISANFTGVRGARGAPAGAQPLGRTADGKPIPLQPWAQKAAQERYQDAVDGRPVADPKARCLPSGTPGSMSPPQSLAMQIIESTGQVTVLFEEFNQFRIIRMNDKHDPDPNPGYFGDSVGHWEGDTLVVDTTGLNDQTVVGGAPHTEALHIVERIRRNGDMLEMERTYDDPKTYTAPWKTKAVLKKVPGLRLHEYFCDNDRNKPDATGRTGVRLP